MLALISYRALGAFWAGWIALTTNITAAAPPASACNIEQLGLSALCPAAQYTSIGSSSPAKSKLVAKRKHGKLESASESASKRRRNRIDQRLPLFSRRNGENWVVQAHVGEGEKPLYLGINLNIHGLWAQSKPDDESQMLPGRAYVDCTGKMLGPKRFSFGVIPEYGLTMTDVPSEYNAEGYACRDRVRLGSITLENMVIMAVDSGIREYAEFTGIDGEIGFAPDFPPPSPSGTYGVGQADESQQSREVSRTSWFDMIKKNLPSPKFTIMLFEGGNGDEGTLVLGQVKRKDCTSPMINVRFESRNSYRIRVYRHAIGKYFSLADEAKMAEITLKSPLITTASDKMVKLFYEYIPKHEENKHIGYYFPCGDEKYLPDFKVHVHPRGTHIPLIIHRENVVVRRFTWPGSDQVWCVGAVQKSSLIRGEIIIGRVAFKAYSFGVHTSCWANTAKGSAALTLRPIAAVWNKIEQGRKQRKGHEDDLHHDQREGTNLHGP